MCFCSLHDCQEALGIFSAFVVFFVNKSVPSSHQKAEMLSFGGLRESLFYYL